MFKKRIVLFGKSVPLAIIWALAAFCLAAAALWILFSMSLAGSIVSLDSAPTAIETYTNDDAFVDLPTFDPLDTGLDPTGPFVAGGAPRDTYSLQDCTSSLSGGDVSISMDNTYADSWCSLKVTVENLTGEDVQLESVAVSGAPIFVTLNSTTPCGKVVLDGEISGIIFDLTPDPLAPAGAFSGGIVDVTWTLNGVASCP